MQENIEHRDQTSNNNKKRNYLLAKIILAHIFYNFLLAIKMSRTQIFINKPV